MMEMVDFARSLNAENRVVGFLWHQGETDAIEGNTPEAYYKQLMDMLCDIRAYYGNIPFVAADFVHEWKNHNLHIAEPIVEVIRRVTETADNAAFVETCDLPSNNQKIGNQDEIHFCRQSLCELGHRYFSAFEGLVGEK